MVGVPNIRDSAAGLLLERSCAVKLLNAVIDCALASAQRALRDALSVRSKSFLLSMKKAHLEAGQRALL